MTIYQWLCIFGVQAFVTAFAGMIVALINNRIQKDILKKQSTKEDTDMLKKAMQVSLRKDLYFMYERAVVNQSVTSDEQKLFLALYDSYHSLRENGVMDEIKNQYLEFKVIK